MKHYRHGDDVNGDVAKTGDIVIALPLFSRNQSADSSA